SDLLLGGGKADGGIPTRMQIPVFVPDRSKQRVGTRRSVPVDRALFEVSSETVEERLLAPERQAEPAALTAQIGILSIDLVRPDWRLALAHHRDPSPSLGCRWG